MRLTEMQAQIIVKDEDLLNKFSIDSKYIIYQGLGHIVLNANLLKEDEVLFDKIKSEEANNYYFRLSFMEDPSLDTDELHCYLSSDKENNNLRYIKLKKLSKTNMYCFLGLNFTIISLKMIKRSKNFNDVPQYKCVIKNISIDKDGLVEEKEIWERTRYGNIENSLSKDLEMYKPFIESTRKRLFKRNFECK